MSEIYGTSSTRRAFSRSNQFRWVLSLDRRDLVGTPWEVKDEPLYFTCHPSPDGALFVVLRRWYKRLVKSVNSANLQEGHRARFWITLAYFKPMKGDLRTKVEILPDGDMRVYYPPDLSTGIQTLDDVMHGRRRQRSL